MTYSITMKQIWGTLRDARLEHPDGLTLNEIYAYLDENQVNMFIHYEGQSKPQALIEGAPACITLTQYADKTEWCLAEAMTRALDDVKFMISNYTKFIEEDD